MPYLIQRKLKGSDRRFTYYDVESGSWGSIMFATKFAALAPAVALENAFFSNHVEYDIEVVFSDGTPSKFVPDEEAAPVAARSEPLPVRRAIVDEKTCTHCLVSSGLQMREPIDKSKCTNPEGCRCERHIYCDADGCSGVMVPLDDMHVVLKLVIKDHGTAVNGYGCLNPDCPKLPPSFAKLLDGDNPPPGHDFTEKDHERIGASFASVEKEALESAVTRPQLEEQLESLDKLKSEGVPGFGGIDAETANKNLEQVQTGGLSSKCNDCQQFECVCETTLYDDLIEGDIWSLPDSGVRWMRLNDEESSSIRINGKIAGSRGEWSPNTQVRLLVRQPRYGDKPVDPNSTENYDAAGRALTERAAIPRSSEIIPSTTPELTTYGELVLWDIWSFPAGVTKWQMSAISTSTSRKVSGKFRGKTARFKHDTRVNIIERRDSRWIFTGSFFECYDCRKGQCTCERGAEKLEQVEPNKPNERLPYSKRYHINRAEPASIPSATPEIIADAAKTQEQINDLVFSDGTPLDGCRKREFVAPPWAMTEHRGTVYAVADLRKASIIDPDSLERAGGSGFIAESIAPENRAVVEYAPIMYEFLAVVEDSLAQTGEFPRTVKGIRRILDGIDNREPSPAVYERLFGKPDEAAK